MTTMGSSGDFSPLDMTRLEAELQAAVKSAKEKYDLAKDEARRLLAISHDVGMVNPDGVSAVSRACELQRIATRDYTDALRRLSDFVLDRKFPLPPPR